MVVSIVVASGCGLVGDSAGKPIPANSRSSFRVQSISGMNFTGGADENFIFGKGVRLSFQIHDISLVSMLSACGPGDAVVRLTSGRLMVNEFNTHFNADNGRCDPERLDATERVSAVISSSPRYRFDGQRLELSSEQTTVTLELIETEDLVVTDTGEIVPKSRNG